MLIEFCLPVKDEEKILEANARRLYDFLISTAWPFDWRIVILINGSQDNSRRIAMSLKEFDIRYFEFKEIVLGGKGRALKNYFTTSWADLLVFMDIDLAVSLECIPLLVKPLLEDSSDLVIGSRLLGDSRINRSAMRSFVSQSYNALSRFLLQHNFSDLQCGFKAIRRELFVRLESYLQDEAWFFDTEIVIWARENNARIQELPVDWQENRYDHRRSKVRVMFDVWSFIINLFNLRFRLRSFRRGKA